MEVVTLEAQSERALFVPALGCQCLAYQVGSLDVIAGASAIETLRAEPFASGIPILFPWPGRIAGARFHWRGSAYALPVNEPGRGHALHGLVYDKPFKVTRRGPCYFCSELDSESDPELTRVWPWRFRLGLDYEVGNGLRLRATAHNTGDRAMPFGLGVHPYFRAPLGPRGTRAAMRLELAAEQRWPLDERLTPLGEPVPVAGEYDLRAGRALGAQAYDDAFSAIAAGPDGMRRARLVDPGLRIAIEVRADRAFREWVVYAPGGGGVVALEPYTCAPDAFNLAVRGIDGGALELKPGESFESTIEIRLTAA